MRKNIIPIFAILVLTVLISREALQAQQYNSKGKEFWLGFMENTPDALRPDYLSVFISANTATTGIVEVPGMRWSQNFNVQANKTVEVRIPTNTAMVTSHEISDPRGVRVTANDPVTVYALNYLPQSSDATIVLPLQTIGKDYTVQAASQNFTSNILIVSNKANTRIQIIPSRTTSTGRTAGRAFQINLNRGEVYQLASRDGEDLTGTRIKEISGTNTISVFGGALCTRIGNCACCCNHLFEQMFPIIPDRMKEYVTVPYKTRRGDIVRVLAIFDTTVVSINNKYWRTLYANQYYDTLLTIPSYIKSNKTISVAQNSRSRECDGIMSSDPFMIVLSSLEMSLDVITFNAFETNIIDNYFVNIISPSSNLDSIMLDGVSIKRFFSTVTMNPQYSYAQVGITPGDHTLSGPLGVIAYVYGYGERESYGYSAGVNIISDFVDTKCPTEKFKNGDTLSFPLELGRTNAILTVGTHEYVAKLTMNGNVLFPIMDSTLTYDSVGTLTIKRKAQDIQLPAVLTEIKFLTMLGDSECTDLHLETLTWDGYEFALNKTCRVCVKLCEEGGKRLILSTPESYLTTLNPNPVLSHAKIKYGLIEDGITKIYVIDVYGKQVKNFINEFKKTGEYSETLDLSALADGIYFLVMQTPSKTIVKKFAVTR
ncbi:MAG: T9SS type A sorting domain-containing protein [Bacteroidota bacterium]